MSLFMRRKLLRSTIRSYRIRNKILHVSSRNRLTVFRSGRHIYAQIINDQKNITIVSASSLDKSIRVFNKSNCNIKVATMVGKLIGDKAVLAGIKSVVFDKGSYKYHGIIKALADSVRSKVNF